MYLFYKAANAMHVTYDFLQLLIRCANPHFDCEIEKYGRYF